MRRRRPSRSARKALRAVVRGGVGLDSPSSTRASSSAMRSVSITRRSSAQAARAADRGRDRQRSPRWPRAGWRASRSRASSASRNSGACRSRSTPRRWCRGRRPRPWSRPRSTRSAPRRGARAAHRRSRHRLGRAAAGAAQSELPGAPRRRHRPEPGGARLRARQRASARARRARRVLAPATTARRWLAPSIWWFPIRPMCARGEIAALAAGGARIRSAGVRSTAAATAFDAYRAIAADARACWRRTA